MPARLVHKTDFESLMAAPTWSRSAHFALHHVARGPHRPTAKVRGVERDNLSTGLLEASVELVDNFPDTVWVGAMVPKRHARRAVMRNLLKRQVRSAFERHADKLPRGLWLVRLRRGFAGADFISARSQRLVEATRLELEELLQQVQRNGPAPTTTGQRSRARPA